MHTGAVLRRALPAAALVSYLMLAACQGPAGPEPVAEESATSETQPAEDAIPRGPDGRPMLDGIWQALAAANWDIRPHAATHSPVAELGAIGAAAPGLGIIDGGEIPYQPWAAALQQEL